MFCEPLRALLAAFVCIAASAASADNLPTPLDAGKLLGKTIGDDRQESIVKAAKPIKADDWELGFDDGPEGGLYRNATTHPISGGDKQSELGFSHSYKDRCQDKDRRHVEAYLALSSKFPVKGETGSQQAIGWISFTVAGQPATPPKRQAFPMDEMLGQLHQTFDPDQLKAASVLTICPTAKPWDGTSKDCIRFSLKGFPRALDYVCDAK